MELILDLDNWKYYDEHPDEIIKDEFIFLSQNLSFNEIVYSIISIIKTDYPNIRKLYKKLDKDISTI